MTKLRPTTRRSRRHGARYGRSFFHRGDRESKRPLKVMFSGPAINKWMRNKIPLPRCGNRGKRRDCGFRATTVFPRWNSSYHALFPGPEFCTQHLLVDLADAGHRQFLDELDLLRRMRG